MFLFSECSHFKVALPPSLSGFKNIFVNLINIPNCISLNGLYFLFHQSTISVVFILFVAVFIGHRL